MKINSERRTVNFQQRLMISATLILLTSHGFAATDSASLLTLRQAIDLAQSLNPDVRSLRHQIESADAKTRQSLAPSEPSLSLTYNDLDKAFNLPNSASTVYQLTQNFAFPGKAFVNHGGLNHQARGLEFQLQAKELDVANTIKSAYFNLALSQKNIELNQETQASYQRILNTAKRRYEAGSITQVDLLNAELALYANQNDLADLETNEKITRSQLNDFLNRPADSPLQINDVKMTPHQLPTLKEAEARMTANRPEIKAAVELTEASDSAYSLAEMSFLPDFQLTAGMTTYNYGPASPTIGGNGATQTYLVGLQATIPLWGVFNEREAIKGASHDKAAADANLDSLQLQSHIALQTSLATLEALQKKITNYDQHLLSLSEQAFRLALVSYSSGKIDFQTLSDTATARRQVRHDYYGLIVSFLNGYSAFGQLIGEDL